MFKTETSSVAETLIGPSVHVKGDFKSQGNVQIDGQVTGTIQTSGTLRVGERALINANINAANAFVAGSIKGNVVVTNRLELTSSAKIEGDVSAKILVMAEGALLNGRCQMVTTSNPDLTNNKNKKDKLSPPPNPTP